MKKRKIPIPDKEQLKKELMREKKKVRHRGVLFGIAEAVIVAAAVTVLAGSLLAPVLQIDGSSMEPLLYGGDMVVSLKGQKLQRGDIVAFHQNNKVLVKRIVALEGETIDIDENGKVYIDDVPLDEDYLKGDKPAFGKCNIALPCKVPEGSVFVMGDNREVSVDSRSIDIGCVSSEQMISKVMFRVWPAKSFGPVN